MRAAKYASVLIALCGSTQSVIAEKEQWQEQAKQLDVVAKQLEQYGIITASAPLLVRADGDSGRSQFEFALKEGAKKYYLDARQDIQGGAC